MKVTWAQALTWRLQRQFLLTPSEGGAVEVVRRLCGVQAQVPSAARLAVALRHQAGAYGPATPKGFDQWVLGPGTSDAAVVPPEHRSRVSRPAGWISPVLLVGGRVAGTWEHTDDGIRVDPFPDAPAAAPELLRAEVERLAGQNRARVVGASSRPSRRSSQVTTSSHTPGAISPSA